MNIAIVTPLKNEIENLPRLFDSISCLNSKIFCWIIVENDSDDGSIEYLQLAKKPKNVENFTVLNIKTETPVYQLGYKYAAVVSTGFEKLKNSSFYSTIDFIGILDADCFPAFDYYEKLLNYFASNQNVGIASGRIVNPSGKFDQASSDWARGGCRLWRKECFLEAGYIVGPSADALSSAKAEIKGWETQSCPSAIVTSRETGARVKYDYYGMSAYFRGLGLDYLIAKTIFLLLTRPNKAMSFFNGYLKSLYLKKPQLEDQELRSYYKKYLWRTIAKKTNKYKVWQKR